MKKINKRFIIDKKGRKEIRILALLAICFLLFLIFPSLKVKATSSVSSNNFNLTLWDDTDSATRRSNWSTFFYANYTNATTGNPITGGNCTIRFNFTGSWSSLGNMSYNSTYTRFQFNRTFNYKGQHFFEVNCTNSSVSINATDIFNITNSIPIISEESGANWIDFDGNNQNHDSWQCTEDALCYYNFTSNVSDQDINDVFSFTFGAENTTIANYTLNETTGLLVINITLSNNTGTGKKIELKVKDNDIDALWRSSLLAVDITAVNDAPVFSNLENKTFNMSELFTYIIQASDEENNIPFAFNITFLNCSTAVWSTRNNTNCSLFNLTSWNNTATLVNLTASRNDVGNYIINFSVRDNNSVTTPYNATRSQIVNFSVLNINSVPWFTYVCDNERNATENTQFTCRINVSDFDEPNNFTIFSNYSWFLSYTNASPINSLSPYNASVLVNFTANDSMVGNWLINISVKDTTENPTKLNSSIISFNISNVNDSVFLYFVNNFTAYENVSYLAQVNASDDDLLIPDKRVYNESLAFSTNVSWINIINYQINGNQTVAYLNFTANMLYSGNNSINLSVRDANNYSIASRIFIIAIFGNNAPQWNSSLNLNQSLLEDTAFSLNLSQHVSDADNDTLTFSYANLSYFPSFSLNSSTGVISFTPNDYDVGSQIVVINVSDNKTIVQKTFNFTINNTNDAPAFGAYANQVAVEDTAKTLDTLTIYDEDFLIPQKNFYNESLILNITIQGANSTLFVFSLVQQTANYSRYSSTFTPSQLSVGSYNITLNVTDKINSSAILRFNLTINSSNDAPALMNITNQTSAVGKTFYLDVNASDEEDGSDSLTSSNLTFSIVNTSGKMFFTINSTTGVINITVNSSYVSIHNYNISVNDTTGLMDSKTFKLTVYDSPYLVSSAPSDSINGRENQTFNVTIIANHSIQDNLNFSWYIDGALKNISQGFGNGTNAYVWYFTPNFTDETCGVTKNLTLNFSNLELSNFTLWNLTINNTNSPVNFLTAIPNQSTTGTLISVALSTYFLDPDANSLCTNQTILFQHQLINCTDYSQNLSSGAITISITNWTANSTPAINFSSSSQAEECFRITAFDLNNSGARITNATSNNFSVSMQPTTTVVTTTSSGGGGSSTLPIALKIIMPDPISAYKQEKIVLPIKLINTGRIVFNDINLTAFVAKNLTLLKDVVVSFDKSYFSSLVLNQEENITMTIDINTDEVGLFEITVNATSKRPVYNDWGKMYLTVKTANVTVYEELIVFAEELVVGNPECIELTELIKEARKLHEEGNTNKAIEKLREIVEACKYAINQRAKSKTTEYTKNKMFLYFIILIVLVFLYFIFFYIFKKIVSNRKV